MSCAPPAVRHVFELAEPAKPRKKYEHCYRRTTHPEYVRLQGNARTCERTRTASKVRRRMGVGRRSIHGPGTATDETQGSRKLPLDRRGVVLSPKQKNPPTIFL